MRQACSTALRRCWTSPSRGGGERSSRVSLAQIAQHVVEALKFGHHTLASSNLFVLHLEAACHQVGYAVGAHALAAGIVDRRRHTRELP